jgi:Ca-activated chloride channel homolog
MEIRTLIHRSFVRRIAVLLLVMSVPLFSKASQGADQRPAESPFSLRVDVNLVILNVAVIDESGSNVTSLKMEDFEVYEDDVKQEVSDFLPVEAPFDLVLALDTSISTRSSLDLIKKAAGNFADQLRLADRIGIIEINSQVRQLLDSTSDRKKLKLAIQRLATASSGGSKVYDGLAQAVRHLQKARGGRKAVILLSDGMENSSHINFEDLRRLMAQLDVVFYPVTILNKESEKDLLEDFIKKADKRKPEVVSYVENAKLSLSVLEEVYQRQTERLQTLTDETGGKIFLVRDLADLAQEYSKVAQELRNTFSLAYYSKNKGHDGTMRRIRVEVKNPKYLVRSRTSYFVPKD